MVTSVSAPTSAMVTRAAKSALVIPNAEMSSRSWPPVGLASNPEYSVVPKPRAEYEQVVARTAVHRVVAGSADNDVVARPGIDCVVATLALQAVDDAIAGNRVVA